MRIISVLSTKVVSQVERRLSSAAPSLRGEVKYSRPSARVERATIPDSLLECLEGRVVRRKREMERGEMLAATSVAVQKPSSGHLVADKKSAP